MAVHQSVLQLGPSDHERSVTAEEFAEAEYDSTMNQASSNNRSLDAADHAVADSRELPGARPTAGSRSLGARAAEFDWGPVHDAVQQAFDGLAARVRAQEPTASS